MIADYRDSGIEEELASADALMRHEDGGETRDRRADRQGREDGDATGEFDGEFEGEFSGELETEFDREFDANLAGEFVGPVCGGLPDAFNADYEFTPLVNLPGPFTGKSDAEACSVPHSVPLLDVLRRTFRMTAPFVVSDVLVLVACGMLAQLALSLLYPAAAVHYRWISPFVLLPLVLFYAASGMYTEIWAHPVIELRHLTLMNSFALLAAAAGAMMARPFPIWCAAAWPLVIFLLPLSRCITRHRCARRSKWGYPTLVIGEGNDAITLANTLTGAPRSGLRPVVLTDPTGRCRASDIPMMNDPALLASHIRAEGIRHAVISMPQLTTLNMTDLLDRFAGLLPHLLVLSDASTLPNLWGASRRCGRLTGIEVRNGSLLPTMAIVKRTVDLAISLTVLILLSVPILCLMLLTKLTSPGPVFFGHNRIGQHGKRFNAWKFRSMCVDSKEVLRHHLATNAAAREEWGRTQKLKNDPRITRIGAFLRKTSLDELPQLWNVLRGDMSLVGPRPIVEDEVARYGSVFGMYTSVKPGITGLWQVSGRNRIGYEERVKLDQFYVRHWSPWLDAYILGRTVITLIYRDGI